MNIEKAGSLAPDLRSVISVYGPYAFGIVSVLVLHLGIYQPQIDNLREDYRQAIQVAKEADATANKHESQLDQLESMIEDAAVVSAILDNMLERAKE